MGTFECLVLLVLKKASSSSAARCWRTSTCSSQAWYQQCFYQVTTRQREMMTCFPKAAYLGREPGGFHVSFSLKKLNLGIPQRSHLTQRRLALGLVSKGRISENCGFIRVQLPVTKTFEYSLSYPLSNSVYQLGIAFSC